MAEASTPPWVPTPICRIEVVKAAISPPMSARCRRETHFLKKLPRLDWARLSWDADLWDVSSDFLRSRKRIHSSSSNCSEAGPLPFHEKNKTACRVGSDTPT